MAATAPNANAVPPPPKTSAKPTPPPVGPGASHKPGPTYKAIGHSAAYTGPGKYVQTKAVGHSLAYRGPGTYVPYKAPAVSTKPADWLAPQSQAALASQAQSTITKAYAPQFQSFDQAQTRAQAISDKRASDNKYYTNWLNMQGAALQAHQDQANQAIMQQENENRFLNASLYPHGTPQQTGITPGVSQALEQRNLGLLGNSGTQLNANMGTGNDMLAAARANDTGLVLAANTKQRSDLNTALTNIANQRAVAKTKETGDIAKEVARLSGVEIQKAQSTRNYAAAVQKLGLTAATLQEKTINDRATQATNTAKVAATLRGQDLQHTIDQLKIDLGNKNLTERQRHDKQTELTAAQNAQTRQKNAAGKVTPYGVKPHSAAFTQATFDRIDRVRGGWTQLVQAGHNAGEIYNFFLNGGTLSNPANPKKPFTSAPHDMHEVLAAQDLVQRHGHLSNGTATYLHKQGYMINGRWPVDAPGVTADLGITGNAVQNTGL